MEKKDLWHIKARVTQPHPNPSPEWKTITLLSEYGYLSLPEKLDTETVFTVAAYHLMHMIKGVHVVEEIILKKVCLEGDEPQIEISVDGITVKKLLQNSQL